MISFFVRSRDGVISVGGRAKGRVTVLRLSLNFRVDR